MSPNTFATVGEFKRPWQSFFSNYFCFLQHDRTVTLVLLLLLLVLPSYSRQIFTPPLPTTVRGFYFASEVALSPHENNMSQIFAWSVLRDQFCHNNKEQPLTKDKGDIGLDWEEQACGGTTLWMKWYYLNISFTHAQCQVQLVFIVFQLFSVDRRNKLESYTVMWAKMICFVLFEMNCISVAAGAWVTPLSGVFVSLSRQVSPC